ncbi:MAG: NFACT family protein [Clostridia bacterium]|nr:NFACT family protein [Clostridia bacterium]
MPQDAFTLRLISKELNSTLAGGHINKIVQPSRDEVSLVVYTGRKTLRLVLNANASDCGAYFDEGEVQSPLVAPNFCMLLRKHLSGAQIASVSLVGFERILLFTLIGSTDFSRTEKLLYLEVMGKYSNLVLTENGIILGALKTTTLDENVRRTIFPGVKYELPAPQEKVNPQDLKALESTLSMYSGDLAHYLFTRISGLAPQTAEQIAASYRGGSLAEHVHSYIFSDMVSPCVLEREGIPIDFFARQVKGATPYPTLSAAQTAFYGTKRAVKKFEGLKRKLTSAVHGAVKKHEKRLAQTLEKRKACEDCENLRIKGELITANLYALAKGMKSCELSNWYDASGGTLKITLDPQLTPSENAQSFFKRYRKQKRTLEMLAPQEAETRAELDYLSSVLSAISSAETEEDLLSCEEELVAAELIKQPQQKNSRGKKVKAEIPYRTFEAGGFRIFAGRNNLQNDRLVRSAAPDDLWLHAQRYHSCHVVIKTEGRTVPEEVLAYAANICAKYSDSNGDAAPVDCCPVKYVKKPPKSKAGFVTYSHFITLSGNPMP